MRKVVGTAAWTVSLVFTFLRWRAIRNGGGSKIPPFNPPMHEQGASYEDGAFNAADEDEPYDAPRPMYQNPDARPSGTFGERPYEDPLPSGYNMGQSRQSNPFQDPTPSYDDPCLSTFVQRLLMLMTGPQMIGLELR